MNVHTPYPTIFFYHTYREIKNMFNMSLILTHNKTNTKNRNISIPTE